MPLQRRSDWALLAVAIGRGDGLGPVQLQKTLFLLGREMPNSVGPDFYEFIPYNYGPFSREIYEDAERLQALGLLTRRDHMGGDWEDFIPTAEGIRAASAVAARVGQPSVAYLTKVIRWAQEVTFDQLVRAIYAKYPEYKENSLFRG